MAETEYGKDAKGRDIIVVPKNGQVPTPTDKNIIPEKMIKNALETRFEPGIDFEVILETVLDKISDQNSISKATGALALRSYRNLSDLNTQLDKIIVDQSRTPGAKLLLKEEMAKPLFDNLSKNMTALDLAMREEMTKNHKDLFSSNIKMTQTEESVLGTFAGMIKDKDLDVNNLIASTPEESRIALNLVRSFPNLVPNENGMDNSIEALSKIADYEFSPEQRHTLDQLEDLFSEFKGLLTRHREDKNRYLDPSVLETIKNSIVKG
jgi:hypothetical protein